MENTITSADVNIRMMGANLVISVDELEQKKAPKVPQKKVEKREVVERSPVKQADRSPVAKPPLA